MKKHIIRSYDNISKKYEDIKAFKTYKNALKYLKLCEVNNTDYFLDYHIVKYKITNKDIIRYYKIAFYILTFIIIITALI